MNQIISPLRQRMIDDMSFRNMSPNTQKVYTRAVANFARYHGTPPDKLGLEDIRDYRRHLLARGLKSRSVNPIVAALRFFYGTTLSNTELARQITFARTEDNLPAILTQEQVLRLLQAVTNLKMLTILVTIYGAGLRISEVVRLKPGDINNLRMTIHIRQAKGQKDRYVMLSRHLLESMRHYWRRERPQGMFLFPGPVASQPITVRSVQRAFRKAADRAGLDRSVSPHTLRHCFATHLLEQGVDVRVIQNLLGHNNINSTSRYTRVAVDTISRVVSPLDQIALDITTPG
jgi:site-specific recombinase XerD